MPTTRNQAGLDWEIVRPEDYSGGGVPLILFLKPFWLRARIQMFEIDGDAFLAVEFAYQKLATGQSLSIADLDNAVEEVYNIHRYKSSDGGPTTQ
ncbi:uncharacterized protein RHO25_013174 [Cercospora beticola]|uniref:Uncharacterized protein n=1 Tax=Cercospora beticola TaxID=122368 RepID=A0ABZ0P9K4_CERBT|nr:hypothetical protein RHO25_013174 [Cercospora beticola]CAK1356628.1 unnamed protein product [Cercospora beticola]